jgi:(d)CTP diphosphatase
VDEVEVTAAIIERDGRYLVAKRNAAGPVPALWEFPGGKVERGETRPDALRRELFEEFGLLTTIGAFVTSSVFDYPHARIHLFAYRASYAGGTPDRRVHEEIRWASLEELRSLPFSPADVPLIDALAEARA